MGLRPPARCPAGRNKCWRSAAPSSKPRRLLLIDEPTKGLSPAMVDQLVAALSRLKREHTTILLVEQNFRVWQAVGDDVAVMDEGRIIHTGEMAALATNHGLQHRLLGLSVADSA